MGRRAGLDSLDAPLVSAVSVRGEDSSFLHTIQTHGASGQAGAQKMPHY